MKFIQRWVYCFAITSVALISMTDVVFLLLIFLLITSSYITNTGIKINIPDTRIPENIQPSAQLQQAIQDIGRQELPGPFP